MPSDYHINPLHTYIHYEKFHSIIFAILNNPWPYQYSGNMSLRFSRNGLVIVVDNVPHLEVYIILLLQIFRKLAYMVFNI